MVEINGTRPPGDLTGRARVRDAALEEFAERGVRGATVRSIAARAGVSPALVQHHFGTKERLRSECDGYVVDYLRRQASAGLDDGAVADPGYLNEVYRSAPPALRYLARALVDGSEAAATVFDELVDLTERYLMDRSPVEGVGGADVRAQAVVLTAMRLGVTVLHDHVTRGLGVEVFGPEGGPRVGRASLDVLAPGLLRDGKAERARAGLDDFQNRTRKTGPPADEVDTAERTGHRDRGVPADDADIPSTRGGQR